MTHYKGGQTPRMRLMTGLKFDKGGRKARLTDSLWQVYARGMLKGEEEKLSQQS